jgi:hypothetical protein
MMTSVQSQFVERVICSPPDDSTEKHPVVIHFHSSPAQLGTDSPISIAPAMLQGDLLNQTALTLLRSPADRA